jgi:hypothetical protein
LWFFKGFPRLCPPPPPPPHTHTNLNVAHHHHGHHHHPYTRAHTHYTLPDPPLIPCPRHWQADAAPGDKGSGDPQSLLVNEPLPRPVVDLVRVTLGLAPSAGLPPSQQTGATTAAASVPVAKRAVTPPKVSTGGGGTAAANDPAVLPAASAPSGSAGGGGKGRRGQRISGGQPRPQSVDAGFL